MGFIWPKNSVVRIVTSDIFAGDAIGNFNLQIRLYFESLNIPCKLYATNFDDSADLNITHYDNFFEEYNENDILLSHFSIYEKRNKRLKDVHIPKAVYYHGITPPEYFTDYESQTADNCRKGLNQFHCYRDFDFYLSNSAFMLEQLISEISGGDKQLELDMYSRSKVLPPFINANQWECKSNPDVKLPDGEISLLYVGRIAPHKCIHELYELVDKLVNNGTDASLRIVGSCAAPLYCEELEGLLQNRYSDISHRIKHYGHISQAQLKHLYMSSSLFVTMSEHEGFCVPLVEAMRFSLPILAKARGAIPETLGGSGMVFYDTEFDDLVEYISNISPKQIDNSLQSTVYNRLSTQANGNEFISLVEKLLQLKFIKH